VAQRTDVKGHIRTYAVQQTKCTGAQLFMIALSYGRAPTFAERDLWNSRQRGRATCALFETLCFQNGLGGRRGKERDQRSCGVSLTVAGNDAGDELGVVLNR